MTRHVCDVTPPHIACRLRRARPLPTSRPPGWLHEIKHDGYRLIARLDGRRARLFSRRGHDWTERFPRIRATLAVLRARSATIDGEAVVCCPKDANEARRADTRFQPRQHGAPAPVAEDQNDAVRPSCGGWPASLLPRMREGFARAHCPARRGLGTTLSSLSRPALRRL